MRQRETEELRANRNAELAGQFRVRWMRPVNDNGTDALTARRFRV
jgi:hypothetical protein